MRRADAELGACLVEAASAERGAQLGLMLPGGVSIAQRICGGENLSVGRVRVRRRHWRVNFTQAWRALDAAGCTVILCPLPPAEGIGAAIRDRLLKAGTKKQGPRERGTGD
ncbi:MAG: Sua5 family C-terminal domain-containing protein [Terracidiphilus sp.]